jgi:hypothetical protein
MARHVRATLFPRKSLPNLLLELQSRSPAEWPLHLYDAWLILHDEMAVPDDKCLAVVLDSVSSAHRFLAEENRQICKIEEFRICGKIAKLFGRVSRRASRAPAALRRHLDARIGPLIQDSVIDLEVIESIFRAVKMVFQNFPECEATRTGLELLEELGSADFSLVTGAFRSDLEQTIFELVNAHKVKRRTLTVRLLNVLAAAIDGTKTSRPSSMSYRHVTSYVRRIAQIWRSADLRPTRARSFWDKAYESKFHRFAELVLAGLANLGLKRQEFCTRTKAGYATYEWHLSEAYVRAALGK